MHPRGIELLARFGLDDSVRSMTLGRTPRGRVLCPDGRLIADERFEDGGFVLTRGHLDALLLDAAERDGVRVTQPATATVRDRRVEIRVEDGSVRVVTPALVVGADGLGSGVARGAKLMDPRRTGRKFGFAFDIDGASVPSGEITMCVAGGGYLGMVSEGSDRVHLAGLLPALTDAPTKPRETLAWFGMRFPIVAALGGVIGPIVAAGPMPWRTTKRTDEGVALVGDAAGYVEPFTGEGMTWAIESALMLVDAIARGPFDQDARRRYESRWTEALAPRHRRCAIVAGLVERPRLLRTFGTMRAWVPGLGRQAMKRLVPR